MTIKKLIIFCNGLVFKKEKNFLFPVMNYEDQINKNIHITHL